MCVYAYTLYMYGTHAHVLHVHTTLICMHNDNKRTCTGTRKRTQNQMYCIATIICTSA